MNQPGRAVKRLQAVEVKAADRGEVRAVFSRFGVVDSDGDVTDPDAFEVGAEVPISAYQHTSWAGALPVGKGTIRANAEKAWIDSRFFLDTQAGRETFTVVCELGSLGQWSYGYDVLDSDRGTFAGRDVRFLKKLKVHEVSPVLVGAGVDVTTLDAKDAAQAAALREYLRFVVGDSFIEAAQAQDAAAREYLRFVHATMEAA